MIFLYLLLAFVAGAASLYTGFIIWWMRDEPPTSTLSRKWDEGEHEGCGIDTYHAVHRRELVAKAIFGVMYGSENWDNALWLLSQDLAYVASDKALAVTRPEGNSP